MDPGFPRVPCGAACKFADRIWWSILCTMPVKVAPTRSFARMPFSRLHVNVPPSIGAADTWARFPKFSKFVKKRFLIKVWDYLGAGIEISVNNNAESWVQIATTSIFQNRRFSVSPTEYVFHILILEYVFGSDMAYLICISCIDHLEYPQINYFWQLSPSGSLCRVSMNFTYCLFSVQFPF